MWQPFGFLSEVFEPKGASVQTTLCEGPIDTVGARVTCTYGKGLGTRHEFVGVVPPSPPFSSPFRSYAPAFVEPPLTLWLVLIRRK